jgi:hypothetical protein
MLPIYSLMSYYYECNLIILFYLNNFLLHVEAMGWILGIMLFESPTMNEFTTDFKFVRWGKWLRVILKLHHFASFLSWVRSEIILFFLYSAKLKVCSYFIILKKHQILYPVVDRDFIFYEEIDNSPQ